MSEETVELSEKLTVKLKTAGVDKLQDLAKSEVRAGLVFDEEEAAELIMALEIIGVTTWILAVKVETPPPAMRGELEEPVEGLISCAELAAKFAKAAKALLGKR